MLTSMRPIVPGATVSSKVIKKSVYSRQYELLHYKRIKKVALLCIYDKIYLKLYAIHFLMSYKHLRFRKGFQLKQSLKSSGCASFHQSGRENRKVKGSGSESRTWSRNHFFISISRSSCSSGNSL